VRHAVLVLALVALVAPVGATGDLASPTKTPRGVLAMGWTKSNSYLVRLNTPSLKPRSRRLWLNSRLNWAWSFAPDRKKLAIGLDRPAQIRLVDTSRLRAVGTIQIHSGRLRSVAWLTERTLIAYWLPDIGADGLPRLLFVDPVARRVTRTIELERWAWNFQPVGQRLVLLLSADERIEAARLAVVDADGTLRQVTLDRILLGGEGGEGSEAPRAARPGFAVDAAGRAFVVGSAAGEPVAEVDLATTSVTYRLPKAKRSLLGRLRDWLEPAATAKTWPEGGYRSALWLGEERLAVTGFDATRTGPSEVDFAPAGLSIIDTDDWTTEQIDHTTTGIAQVPETLLATDPIIGKSGLVGYSLAGTRRYKIFDGRPVYIDQTLGETAFVTAGRQSYVVDATRGRILGRRMLKHYLLTTNVSGW
jgi:hypothetical protein